MDARHWLDQLRPLFQGRRVIVKHEVLAGATPTVSSVRRLGGAPVLVLATSGTGTGELPDAECLSLDIDVADLTPHAAVQAGQAALRDLPGWVVERLDAFDPERTAVVVGDFLNESPELAGRRFLAHRRPEWVALDDKTVVDALWDRVGVRRSPSRIVPAVTSEVSRAIDELGCRGSAVLAVDSTRGWTGGGSGTRRVAQAEDVEEAVSGWSGQRVRVMPFLEGIPCSVHGIVFPKHVVALRPVEMIVLRRGDGTFVYCGCASFWDPPAAEREYMREVARRVGSELRVEVGYRGAFTIDGVVTADGFLPTELNPRNGAGLVTMARSLDLPLQLLLDALVGGVEADWRPSELEAYLLDHFDTHRSGGTWRGVPVAIDPAEVDLDDGHMSIGPSPIGSFVRVTFEHPVGEPVGPRAAEFWTWADGRWGLGLGPLTCAIEARPPSRA